MAFVKINYVVVYIAHIIPCIFQLLHILHIVNVLFTLHIDSVFLLQYRILVYGE